MRTPFVLSEDAGNGCRCLKSKVLTWVSLEAKEQTGLNKVVVYSKEGCHLCERVVAELQKLRNERLFEISVKDITTNSELFERYRNIIPVIVIDDKVRLAGAMLANPNTIEDVLRKTVFSINFEQESERNSGYRNAPLPKKRSE